MQKIREKVVSQSGWNGLNRDNQAVYKKQSWALSVFFYFFNNKK